VLTGLDVDVRVLFHLHLSSCELERNVTNLVPTVDSMVGAIRLIDERLEGAADRVPLRTLRERIVGELLLDAGRGTAVLAPDFRLVTHAGDGPVVTDREGVVRSLRQLETARGQLLLWVELDDLVAGHDAAAAHGTLRMLLSSRIAEARGLELDVRTDELVLTTASLALFVRSSGGLMTSEVVFMQGAGPSASVVAGSLPSLELLRSAIGENP
jgi:hypothetical protein